MTREFRKKCRSILKLGVNNALPAISGGATSVVCLLILSVFILSGASLAGQGPSLLVTVDHVIDGDSLVVRHNGKAMEVRLWGIDAPEYDQPYSSGAQKALKNMTDREVGRLIVKYQDKYDRYVAVLMIDEVNVNQELVKRGHSWVYGRYCNEPICAHWEVLQAKAKADRLGLWHGSDPVSPWQWKARR